MLPAIEDKKIAKNKIGSSFRIKFLIIKKINMPRFETSALMIIIIIKCVNIKNYWL